jgi:hypothetical protein
MPESTVTTPSYTTPWDTILARKLAVILHRLWCDGTSFRWSTQKVSG